MWAVVGVATIGFVFLVAPTEPVSLRSLGATSAVPERHGCDVVWNLAGGGLAGVQRKTLTDLWFSLRDGRLAREVAAMEALARRVLVIEGRVRWSAAGVLTTGRTGLSRDQLRGLVLSLQARQVLVVHADDLSDTVAAVVHVRRWLDKARHPALDLRPSPASPPGGGRAWGVHLLQSFPLVGPTVAGAIWDHFDGVPLVWSCSPADLAAVPGVGKVRAATLLGALPAAGGAAGGGGG